MSAGVQAQPVGGSVVAGQAQISSSGATTLINQSTAKAIINWQDFSVGAGAAVQFNQPNSSAITLNRVTGPDISTIDGAIRANGQVWLLNPNGILFGNGGTIRVGGLLATTSDIADQDFLASHYNFNSTGGKGSVTNAGTITASNGGSVVLSSPSVINKGVIQANAGHVVLGGTDSFTVDFNGDHLLSYAVSPNSTGGKVLNSGGIAASGGTVLLTARAAAGVQDAVINNSGMVEATSVRQENGEIILEANNGTVSSSGTLDASGKAGGETGGTVKLLGQQVAVADGAKIDVSGDAGGGTAIIGGNLHGAGPDPNAQGTTVGKAIINAGAITSGKGGTVAVYSTGKTSVAAAITAAGGASSGDGGMVETSGHTLGVAATTTVSTAAPHGTPGDWLLDPDNITIATGGVASASGETFAVTGNVTIDPVTIATALGGGNVTLQANQDITVNNGIQVTTNNTLELDAGHSIIVNASIVLNAAATAAGANSTLILSANDIRGSGNAASASINTSGGSEVYSANIILQLAGVSSGIGSAGTPFVVDYADNGASTMTLTVASASSVFLTSHADNTQISAAGANAGNNSFSLNADVGPILQAPGGAITASSIALQTSSAAVGAGTPITVFSPSGSLALLVNTGGLADASINSNNPVTLGALNTANFSLTSAGAVNESSAISVGNLSISTASTIALNNTSNAFAGTVVLNSGGSASLVNSGSTAVGASSVGAGSLSIASRFGSVSVTGAVSGSSIGLTAGSGSVTQGGAATITAGALSVNAATNITLTAAGNNVGSVTLTGGTGSSVSFVNGGPTLSLGYVGGSGATILGSASITSAGAISLSATPGSEINGRIISIVSNGAVGNGTPIMIDDAEVGDTIQLSVNTSGNAAAFNAPNSTAILNVINTGATGNFTLSALGPISQQTSGITSRDLNITATGAGNNITLTNGGNAVSGTVRFSAVGAASFTNGASIATTTLGSSAVQSNITVTALGSTLNLTDTSGGVDSANVVLSATNLIDQAFPGANLPIGAGNLTATVTNSSTGSLRLLDSGGGLNNRIGGIVTLTAGTNGGIGFSNTLTTRPNVTGPVSSLEIDAIDPAGTTTPAINLVVSLQATSSIQLSATGDIQTSSGFSLTAPSISLSSLQGAIGASSVPIPLSSPSVAIGLSVSNAGTGSTFLTADKPVNLFNASLSGGGFDLETSGGLSNIVVTSLNTANAPVVLFSTGSVFVMGNVTDTGGTVFLEANSGGASLSPASISSPGGTLSAANVAMLIGGTGTGTIGAAGAPFQIASASDSVQLAVQTGNQSVYLNSQNAVNIGSVSGALNISGVNLGRTSGDFVLSAAGPVTISNSISMAGIATITTPGDITIGSGANILAGTAAAPGTTDIFVQAGGNFINSSGLGQNTLIAANSGFFNVYSQGPFADSFGGLDSKNQAIWNTNYLTPITASGSRYIFAFQPSLTLSTGNVSKTYGTDGGALVSGLAFNVTGLQPGVPGVYLADTAASVYSGNAVLISAGAAPTANVGSYALTLSNLTVGDGYALTNQGGTLTVTPATLSYVANVASRIYGSPAAALSGTVTGFVNGDTLKSSTTGTAVFSSTASQSSGVGSYAITGAGLSAANYVLVQSAANGAALTITPAILTYAATAATRPYGSANPVFGGTVLGFVNSDTLASATTGVLVFTSSAIFTSPVGSYEIDASGLSATNYAFVQAPGNATALTIIAAAELMPSSLASVTNSIQPPVPSSVTATPLSQASLAPPPVPLPPPPSPPLSQSQPVQSPLAELSDPPNSSDQPTTQLALSLDHATITGALGVIVIPQLLSTAPPPTPSDFDASVLSSFGNSSLWQ